MKIRKIAVLALCLLLAAASVFATGEKDASEDGVKTLRVAMECSYTPFNWTQATDANGAVQISGSTDYANGYDVMMAKLIAERLGLELEIVKLDWESLIPALQSGTVDCTIAGQSITSDRLQMVDFSLPYYYASIITLVSKDSKYASAQGIDDLAGAVCTSQQNTVWYDVCLPQIPGAKILPAQESVPAMLVALSSGRADLICTDMPTGQAALMVYPDFRLLDFSQTDNDYVVSDEEINIGVAVSKKNPELTAAINSVLETLTVEDFNSMMDYAISVQPLAQ